MKRWWVRLAGFAVAAGCAPTPPPVLNLADWRTPDPPSVCDARVSGNSAIRLRRYDAEGRLIFGMSTPSSYSSANEWFTWKDGNLMRVDSYLEERDAWPSVGPLRRTIEHAELTWQERYLASVKRSRREYRREWPSEVWRLHDHEDHETRYSYREGGPWLEFIEDWKDLRLEFEDSRPVRLRTKTGIVRWGDTFTNWSWKDGRIATYLWSNYVERFEYDAKGRPEVDRLDDTQGRPVSMVRYEYDQRGSVQRVVTQQFNPHGPPDESVRTVRYDDAGREIATSTVSGGVETTTETVYSGNCAKVQQTSWPPPNVLAKVNAVPCFSSPGGLYNRCF